jgi:hypothetical protein
MGSNNDTNFFWQSKYTAGKSGELESESFVDGSDAYANGGKMVLSFLHVASKKSVFFKAFITKYDENWKADWKSNVAFGRTDPIYTYSNTIRNISLAFSVPASSESEAFENMGRIQSLSQMLYPTYMKAAMGTKKPGGWRDQLLLSQAPLVRIKVLNLIQASSKSDPAAADKKSISEMTKRNDLYNQYLSSPDPELGLLCAINNISVSTEMTKEGVLEKGPNTVMPVNYNVSVEFSVIHEETIGWDDEGNALAPNYPYGAQMWEAPDDFAVSEDQNWNQRLDKERQLQAAIDTARSKYAGLLGGVRARQDRNRAEGDTYVNLGVVGIPAFGVLSDWDAMPGKGEWKPFAPGGAGADGGTQGDAAREYIDDNDLFRGFK